MSDISSLVRGMIQAVRFGADDSRAVVLAFAVAAVIVALLAVAFTLISSLVSRGTSSERTGLPRHARGTGAVFLVAAASAVLFGVAVSHYSASSSVCVRCHEATTSVRANPAHEGVECVRCHVSPGVTGWVVGQVDYVRWLTAAVQRLEPFAEGDEAFVSSRACLRCHDEIAEGVTTVGAVRVRHVDFLEQSCVGCHSDSGHRAVAAGKSAMRACIGCHDGRAVAADCSMCHVGDIASVTAGEGRSRVTKVSAPMGTDCRGCHDVDACTECHGLEMPHPPGWMPGHAAPGLTEKRVCWRCHPGPDSPGHELNPYAMCNQCHRFPGPHGDPAAWVRDHGAAAEKRPGSTERRKCGLCHRREAFCDLCHEGRRERVDYVR